MDKYFILEPSEDGLSISSPLTKDELKEELSLEHRQDVNFMTEENFDRYNLSFIGGNIMIIKGDIIVPKPKKVVVDYDI